MYAIEQFLEEKQRAQAQSDSLLHAATRTQVQNGSSSFNGNVNPDEFWGNGNPGEGGGNGNPNPPPPPAPKPPVVKKKKKTNSGNGNGGGGNGGGAGGGQLFQGPGSINGQLLPDVPQTTTTAGTSTMNPGMLVLIIGALGIGGYFLWHKLHMTSAQETALDHGKLPNGSTTT